MRVFILDINFEKDDRSGEVYPWIIGRFRSGLEIKIRDLFDNLQGYIGHHVEMLLCVLRSPYLEYKEGIKDQPFSAEKYYSMELIDELDKRSDNKSNDNEIELINITGRFIDSYIVPQKWIPLIKSNWFKFILKNPSALQTDDGIIILYPFHLRKKVQIESFPKKVTIATGSIDLAAWHPLSAPVD